MNDRMIVAELTGTAQRYARWDEPDEETRAAAVAELREIADGRADLLAKVAGIQLGTKEGTPDEPRARNAAEFCRAAGADPALIPLWVEEGRQRAAQARMPPFSGGLTAGDSPTRRTPDSRPPRCANIGARCAHRRH